MNRALPLLATVCVAVSSDAFAQSHAVLDINDVATRLYSHGLFGMDLQTGEPAYAVPADSATHALFAAGLWLGGVDPGNILHLAAQKYENLADGDFWPGPLDDTGGCDSATSAAYDHVWVIDAADVALHQAYFNCLSDPNCDASVEFPNGYTVPNEFLTWPAFNPAGDPLAPFIDFDLDGAYDPTNGDAPCVPGDRALYAVFNDARLHLLSGGLLIHAQVEITAYGYSSASQAIDRTVFLKYRITNGGTLTLYNMRIGIHTDFDLGNPQDDHMGTDVARSLWYTYNGDNMDEDVGGTDGYGAQPPAVGAVLLQGPLMDPTGADEPMGSTLPAWNGSGFGDSVVDNERLGLCWSRYMLNDASPMGDPSNTNDYMFYLTGAWRDATIQSYGGNGYGGSIGARYAFPDDTDPVGAGTSSMIQPAWSEASAGNVPADRRSMGILGPITFEPGDQEEVVIAIVHARAASGGAWASVQALQARADSVRSFYGTIDPCEGQGSTVGVQAPTQGVRLHIHPVPASQSVMVQVPMELAGEQLLLHDASGRTVLVEVLQAGDRTIQIAALAAGVYTCEVNTPHGRWTGRIIKE